ncbi:glycyl-tRNA synthetase subunit alpha [Streptococcus pneumoniae 6901-05]|nr:glycyl-tRNA synthetase subunit alpha [Streptococcus pneumoniae 6901-05]
MPHTGESFFLIAGGCNTEWMNVFLEELSQAYPDDYFYSLWTMLYGINQVP